MRALRERWNRFFFDPQSPLPIGLFRIFYGSLVIATLLLLRPDWLAWFGLHSWTTLSTMRQIEPGTRLNLFTLFPQGVSGDAWIEAFFWVFLASAVLLTVGLFTRVNSLIVFISLTSIHQRSLYMTHGGDTFLRIAGFFLMFAPAGAAVSIDRLMRIRQGKEGVGVQPKSPWAQRMIQIQLSILYFTAFCLKIQGEPWLSGTALSYVYQLNEIRRFPLPEWFLNPRVLQLGNWFALALEFSLGILIWVKRLRYYLLAIGILFHLTIEYSLNLPLFEWDVLSAYILFVDGADLERVLRRVREYWGKFRRK